MLKTLLALLLFVGSTFTSQAQVVIRGDGGGQIGPYLENLVALRDSGQRVIIDGPCLSACTMVLGVIPRERICVTRRARLGFHAAYDFDGHGRQIQNRGGSQLLMAHYDPRVRAWIQRQGGLTPKMKYLQGRALTSMYRSC